MAGKAGKVRKSRGMRLVSWRRKLVREVVRAVRAENDGPMSPPMRLVADEIAVEILAEQHGIIISPERASRIAS